MFLCKAGLYWNCCINDYECSKFNNSLVKKKPITFVVLIFSNMVIFTLMKRSNRWSHCNAQWDWNIAQIPCILIDVLLIKLLEFYRINCGRRWNKCTAVDTAVAIILRLIVNTTSLTIFAVCSIWNISIELLISYLWQLCAHNTSEISQ